MSSEISYRKGVMEEDFEECLDVVYGAFKDYPVYFIYTNKTDEQQQKFNKSLLHCQLMDAFVHNLVMVAVRDNAIVGVMVIHKPERQEPSVLEYVLHLGGVPVFLHGGLRNTFAFLDMADKLNAVRESYGKTTPCWNLELLAVKRELEGQGIGSKMINECLVPLVKEQGGQNITLITNKERNTLFYKKNDFKELQHEQFDRNNKKVDNWTFLRTL